MLDAYDQLLPRPRDARREPGELILDGVILLVSDDRRLSAGVTRLLAGLGLTASLGDRAPTTAARFEVSLDASLENGSYSLVVTDASIRLVGADYDGVHNGLETLHQLMPASSWRASAPGPIIVPCGRVQDGPVYSWRGAMLDVSRHFYPKRTILRYLDLLAMHKFNRLHLHLSDDHGWRIESRLHPKLHTVGSLRSSTVLGPDGISDGTPHGGYYTLDDLTELSGYARTLGITIVPEIDVPGHTAAIRAAYPELGRPGEMATVLETVGAGGSSLLPTSTTLDFLKDVLGELLEHLDTPYVHLGGDECDMSWWSDDPSVRLELERQGLTEPRELHGWFLRELGAFLAERGKRMIVWDEGFVTGGLLPDTIVMAWRGHGVAQRAAAAGYDVIRAPLDPTYFNFDQSEQPDEPRSQGGPITWMDVAALEVRPAAWSETERSHILGAQFQVWTEWIADERRLDYFVFPRASVLAELLWHGVVDDRAELELRLRAHLERLDAIGVEYRPLEGPRGWQAGGIGDWQRTSGNNIQETRDWIESTSTHAS